MSPESISRETSFTNDLNADSLDIVELLMEFEAQFGTKIPDDQAEKDSHRRPGHRLHQSKPSARLTPLMADPARALGFTVCRQWDRTTPAQQTVAPTR